LRPEKKKEGRRGQKKPEENEIKLARKGPMEGDHGLPKGVGGQNPPAWAAHMLDEGAYAR